MANVTCNSCGGKYDTVGTDGTPYYHACPPERVTIAQASDALPNERVGKNADGTLFVFRKRADHRDENIKALESRAAFDKRVNEAIRDAEKQGKQVDVSTLKQNVDIKAAGKGVQ